MVITHFLTGTILQVGAKKRKCLSASQVPTCRRGGRCSKELKWSLIPPKCWALWQHVKCRPGLVGWIFGWNGTQNKHTKDPGKLGFQGSLYYQPKQCMVILGKSLKITIHLHCLIPPIWVPSNDPSFCWSNWSLASWRRNPQVTTSGVSWWVCIT